MRFHFLFHVPFEGPGVMEPWIRRHQHGFSGTNLWAQEPLPALEDFDVLVVMGGPMNVYEEQVYSWLRDEKNFIARAIAHGKKVLGVCLGAQLIADILGARVYQNELKEIGWHSIQWSAEAKKLKAFTDFLSPMTVFQWHGDTFDIPHGAIRLASSEACAHQAFLYDGRVLGLQFHLEATPDSVRQLVEQCRGEIVAAPFIQPETEILSNQRNFSGMHSTMESILTTFSSGGVSGTVTLEFPLECQFRVIAENISNMHFVIETVLMEHGIYSPLKTQNQSGGGKYLSFSVDARVESREQMIQIDAALRNIAGVKMVL